MSGTSVDSLDAALVSFEEHHPHILNTHSVPINQEIRSSIHRLAQKGDNEIEQIRYLDQAIAQLSCSAIKELCIKANIPTHTIKAVGSHGQTLRHYPKSALHSGYSLQVGDPNIIAHETGITTIADFRRRDIAAGGHGAPLAPAFHKAVFSSKTCDRIILNTGGIANITHLPVNGNVTGYDTGPANGLMDSWCQKHKGKPYDNNGEWAKTGNICRPLLESLLEHTFFMLPPPKSTGREDFNLSWLHEALKQFPTIKAEDVQATLLGLTVESIALAIQQQDTTTKAEVYICGGGSHNTALTSQLEIALGSRPLATTEKLGIHPDWVEAVAFAWLAKQTMEKASSNLPSVTGATDEVILGGIYLA